MTTAAGTATVPTPPPAKKKPRWLRWVLAAVAAGVVLFIAFLILVPFAAGSGWAKALAVDAVRDQVTSGVELDGLSFSWTRGITLRGLRIKNPKGFPPGDAVTVERVQAGLSFSALMRGRFKAQVKVDRPAIHVHVKKGGRINLQELAGTDARRTTGSKRRSKTYEFDSWLKLRESGGSVVIVDEERGLRQELRDIEITLANDGFGKPLLMTMDGKLSGQGGGGTISASGKIDLNRTLPLEFFRFETTGIDLAAYEPLVATLTGERFETFRGKIRGNLSARPAGATKEIEITGNLAIEDLDVRGGPMQPGRGFVAERWKLTPNARVSYENMTGRITGTQVDLGFAKLSALPDGEVRQLFGQDAPARPPLGVVLDIDLAALARQPIVPEGTWRGRLQVRAGCLLPGGGAPLRYAAEVTGTQLQIAGDFLPEGARVPETLRLTTQGTFTRGETPAAGGTYTLSSIGVHGTGRYVVATEYTGTLDATFDATQAGPFVEPFLPPGMKLDGAAKVVLEATGSLPETDRAGGLLAGDLKLSGNLQAPTVSFLGNVLSGIAQKVSLAGGKLSLTPLGDGRLNGGPLALAVNVGDVLGKERKVDFDLRWSGGKAAYGLTPVLQFACPLLAGLPTDDMERMTRIDFQSTAGVSLKGGGPLPGAAADLMAALKKWSAKGCLDLTNGSFTPSTALDVVLKLFPRAKKIEFDDITSQVTIENGYVRTKGFRLGGKDGTVTLEGTTSLAGDLTAKVDFTDLLAKHRDGQRVLGALGNKPIVVEIGGTLSSPKIEMEDFVGNLLKQGIEGAVEGFLKGIHDGKKPKDALEDLLKGLGGRKK